ncbi:hypothetical protein AB6A23_08240 [Paenibacillus tarimensis]
MLPRRCYIAGDPISGFANDNPIYSMNVLHGTVEAEHYDHFPINGGAAAAITNSNG